MNLVFFGSPEFAVPSLQRLASDPDFRLTAVVSQPDRPAGRGRALASPPVAVLAKELGIPRLQPESVRGPEFADRIRSESPDAIAVVAYGKILPRSILEIPPLGGVNVHASLLPLYRGASPIQAALLAGDRRTGVATMRMTEGLDEGPLFLHRHADIGDSDDAGSLSHRLAREGAELLAETLRGLSGSTLEPVAQSGEPTYCRTLRRSDGEIDWSRPAGEILRARRAYSPWPGLFTFFDGERVKLLDARPGPSAAGRAPGETFASADGFGVACGAGTSIEPLRLQREGRRAIGPAEFFRALPRPGRLGR